MTYAKRYGSCRLCNVNQCHVHGNFAIEDEPEQTGILERILLVICGFFIGYSLCFLLNLK